VRRDDGDGQDDEDDDVDLRQLLAEADLAKIQIGSVFCAPAVNVVTITSSNESANASSRLRSAPSRSTGT